VSAGERGVVSTGELLKRKEELLSKEEFPSLMVRETSRIVDGGGGASVQLD
jgi:hypothetical protein